MIQRIKEMLQSGDEEMVSFGVSLLIKLYPHLCKQLIPWNSMEHISVRLPIMSKMKTITGKMVNWDNHDYYTRHPIFLNVFMEEHMWINKNIAIYIYSNRIVCRNLGLMKVLRNFDKIPKTIW